MQAKCHTDGLKNGGCFRKLPLYPDHAIGRPLPTSAEIDISAFKLFPEDATAAKCAQRFRLKVETVNRGSSVRSWGRGIAKRMNSANPKSVSDTRLNRYMNATEHRIWFFACRL